jgi:hypothetical protein
MSIHVLEDSGTWLECSVHKKILLVSISLYNTNATFFQAFAQDVS